MTIYFCGWALWYKLRCLKPFCLPVGCLWTVFLSLENVSLLFFISRILQYWDTSRCFWCSWFSQLGNWCLSICKFSCTISLIIPPPHSLFSLSLLVGYLHLLFDPLIFLSLTLNYFPSFCVFLLLSERFP